MINSGLEKLHKLFESWSVIWRHKVESQQLDVQFRQQFQVLFGQPLGSKAPRMLFTRDVATPKLVSESPKIASQQNHVKLSAQSSSKAIVTFSK